MKCHQLVHYKRLAPLEEKLKPAISYTGATAVCWQKRGKDDEAKLNLVVTRKYKE